MTKGHDDELEALMNVDGVDTASIETQINKIKGVKETPPSDPPKGDPPKGDPPKADPPKADPPKDVLNPETVRTAMLNEMFGEQFKTVEDFKKANIPGQLQELETLRRSNQELQAQLTKKPKHNFASDDIARFNEFARETGIKDAGVFNRINAIPLNGEEVNMDPMDALVLLHIIDNPTLAGREAQVRRHFEKKYGVDSSKIDPKLVESGELTQEELDANKLDYETSLIGVTSDGNAAKKKLKELKDKIKMPEASSDDPAPQTKWTPEVETAQKNVWSKVNEKMGESFSTIPITLKGGKEPLVTFTVPEASMKSILQKAIDYAISNQMEANEANIKSIATSMYDDILISHQEEIYHAIFERARTLSENEILKYYHNPSQKNTDTPPGKGGESDVEETRKKAYLLETT